MDGTQLIGKILCSLLVDCACDAKTISFHRVYHRGVGEQGQLAQFFIQWRDEIVDMAHDVVIIYGRQKGLKEAVYLVFQNAHYSYCFRHLTEPLQGDQRKFG